MLSQKKQNQKQIKSTNKKIIQIIIQSSQDYISLKIILNQIGIEDLGNINIFQKDQKSSNLFKQLLIQLDYSFLIQQIFVKLQQQLTLASIRWLTTPQITYEKFWSLRQFDQIVFGGARWTLLRGDYLSQLQCKIDSIFPKGSPFKITKIEQGSFQARPHYSPKNNYIIEYKDQNRLRQIQPNSTCQSLIKLQKVAVIAFSKLIRYIAAVWKTYQQLLGQLYKIFRDYKDKMKMEVFLQIQYYCQTYMELVFDQTSYLYEFVIQMYSMGYSQFLSWNFKSKQAKLQVKDQGKKLTDQIQARIKYINKELNQNPQNQWTKIVPHYETSNERQAENVQVIEKSLDFIAKQLNQKDLVSLQIIWPSICDTFNEYLYNWDMKKYGINDNCFHTIVKVLHSKVEKFKLKRIFQSKQSEQNQFYLLELILPNIQQYLKGFMKQMKLTVKDIQKIQPKHNEKKESILDQLLKNFIHELQNNGQGQILIKIKGFQQKSLKNFLDQVINLQKRTAFWDDVFNIITINLKNIIKEIDKVNITTNIHKNFLQSIQYEDLPINRCLGCTQFFYLNTNVARGSNNIKIIPQASKIKDYESSIKQSICEMLNNGGGIILFNCTKQYGNIVPNGALLTQKDKEGYENQIMNLLSSIYPKPQLSKNIYTSFVPVMKNPLTLKDYKRKMLSYTGVDQQLKKNQFFYQYMYIEGLYVMRIKVFSFDTSKVYIWSSEDSIYHLSGFEKKKLQLKSQSEEKLRRHYPLSNLRRVIKIKFKNYQKVSKQLYRPPTFANPLAHECINPNSGVKIRQKQQISNQIQINGSLQDTFSHVSMLVVKHKYLSIVINRLKDKAIQCQSEIKFQNYKFKTASNTAILYHNLRFQQILNKISYKTQFQFQGKHVLIISITSYLKLEESNEKSRIDNQQLVNAELWLKGEFPKDRLIFYQLRRQRSKEYYIRTDCKMSILFMYYLLNGFKRKAIFKNPPNVDRMSPSEQKEKFIEIDYHPLQGRMQMNKQSMQFVINHNDYKQLNQIKV